MQGRTLLHYRFIEKIGEGGMGLVYKARDEKLGRLVAIKVLPDSRLEPASRSRFFREARAASALNHPNIITIHEVASSGGTEMIVMEYVEGQTLGELLRGGPLPLADVYSYATQIADALAKAHAAGVIHRDLKPGNIMITADRLVKVLDFGLAKVHPSSADGAGDAPTLELTGARVVMGTAAYMSPEQAAGEPLDGRTDIFSFGVVLYEMIGGRRPFEGQTTLEVLRQLLAQEPVSVERLRTRAPAALLQILSQALAKDRDRRLPSMAVVRDALRAAQAAPDATLVLPSVHASDAPTITMAPATAPSRESAAGAGAAGRKARARRWAVPLAASAAIVLGLAAAFPSFRIGRAGDASDHTVSSSSAYEHFVAGQKFMRRHDRRADLDGAVAAFTKAVETDQQYAPGYAGLADAYYRRDLRNADPQWKRLALDSATQAVTLNPDLALAHISMARALLANGRLEDAEKHATRALELDAQEPYAHLAAAAVQAARKAAGPAESHYRDAVRLASQDWQPYAELGQFLFKAARYQEAVDEWRRCAALAPDNVVIHRQLGAAYHMLDRPDDAATEFQRALQIEPTASVYNNLGTLRFFQGRYVEAVAAFRQAVKMRSNSYVYWGNLGDALRWNPPTRREAAAAYGTAIQLAGDVVKSDPNNGEIRADIAVYRAKSGDAAGAQKDLAAAESGKAVSPGMLFKATVVYELVGERDKALAALQRTLDAGYSAGEIRNEPDLLSLRTDPRFHVLMSRNPPRR